MKDRKLQKMCDQVDIEFEHAKILMAVYEETQLPKDHSRALRQEAKAAKLLDEYNAAVRRSS